MSAMTVNECPTMYYFVVRAQCRMEETLSLIFSNSSNANRSYRAR